LKWVWKRVAVENRISFTATLSRKTIFDMFVYTVPSTRFTIRATLYGFELVDTLANRHLAYFENLKMLFKTLCAVDVDAEEGCPEEKVEMATLKTWGIETYDNYLRKGRA
jgi:hypothetical protein